MAGEAYRFGLRAIWFTFTTALSTAFVGRDSDSAADFCLEEALDRLQDLYTVSEIADGDGTALKRDGLFDSATARLTAPSAIGPPLDLTVYQACRVIDNHALATVTHITPTVSFAAESDYRSALVASISIDRHAWDDLSGIETFEQDGINAGLNLWAGTIVHVDSTQQDSRGYPVATVTLGAYPNERGWTTLPIDTFPGTGRLTNHEGTCDVPIRPALFDLGHLDDYQWFDVEVTLTQDELLSGRYLVVLSSDGLARSAFDQHVIACGPIVDAYS